MVAQCARLPKTFLSENMLRVRLSGEITIDSRNGPLLVFSSIVDIEMEKKWLSEMAQREMGLWPSDILDIVQDITKKNNRKTVFTNEIPSYTWYYNFMARNLVKKRKELSL